MPQFSRTDGSTRSALYLEVFLAKGLHLCSINACEDALFCTKETGGKEEKPRTIKIYFCFFLSRSERSTALCPPAPCLWSFPRKGALGMLAPQGLLPCGQEGQKQGCWQGPADTGRPPDSSRAAGSVGSSHPVPVGQGEGG